MKETLISLVDKTDHIVVSNIMSVFSWPWNLLPSSCFARAKCIGLASPSIALYGACIFQCYLFLTHIDRFGSILINLGVLVLMIRLTGPTITKDTLKLAVFEKYWVSEIPGSCCNLWFHLTLMQTLGTVVSFSFFSSVRCLNITRLALDQTNRHANADKNMEWLLPKQGPDKWENLICL